MTARSLLRPEGQLPLLATRWREAVQRGDARLVADLGITVLATMGARAMTLLTLGYSARVLGQETFGLVNFGTAIAAYAAILTAPGLLVWGTRAVAVNKERAGYYLAVINSIQLLLAGLAYALLVAFAVLALPRSQWGVVMASGLLVFAMAVRTDWVAQGLQRFRLAGIAQLTNSAVTLGLTVLFVRSVDDALRVPLALFTGQIVAAAIPALVLPRFAGAFRYVLRNDAASVLRAALPLGLASAMITVLHYANSIALQYRGQSTDMGTFAAAFRLLEAFALIPAVASTVFLPRLSRAAVESLETTIVEASAYIRFLVVLGAAAAALFAADAPTLVHALYGNQYDEAAPLLKLLSLGIFFNFVAVAYINCLVAMRSDRAYLWSIFVGMVVSILGALFLVPWRGAAGAAIGIACADLATALVAILACRRAYGRYFLRQWLVPIVTGSAIAGWLTIANTIHLSILARWVLAGTGCAVALGSWKMLAATATRGDNSPR